MCLLLERIELNELGLRRVVFVQGITAADESVARRGRAIAERAADYTRMERTVRHGVGQDIRITEHRAPDPDDTTQPCLSTACATWGTY